MPARTDLKSILIIGSGPIMIGQACEFDYSGTQAVRTLKKLGYRVVLVNSNPATIMTDPELADATYLEPLTTEYVEQVIAKERPDALLPTMGGQTALNLARTLYKEGILENYGVELIGAGFDAIDTAEDRGRFQKLMVDLGLDIPRGGIAGSLEEAEKLANEIGFPLLIRPAYTLGGIGASAAYNIEEFMLLAQKGLTSSPVSKVLIEESLIGWKEFELEVMRDRVDNVVVICSIENINPLGIHTGDSITVAPAQTLTDKEYQVMRDAAIQVIRGVGVDTGGSNIQFGLNPDTGRMVVIEMNPRVSRSSALASKATGFPIAKVAAQLAVGFTLGEIQNEITGQSVSAFEPTLDYVVVKIPRWPFEKFPTATRTLGSQMKSVGETMAIGRTFCEALQKAIRGLETGRHGLGADGYDALLVHNIEAHMRQDWKDIVTLRLKKPDPNQIFFLRYALALDIPIETIYQATGIDPWFLNQINKLLQIEGQLVRLARHEDNPLTHREFPQLLMEAKRHGFSDIQIGNLTHQKPSAIRKARENLGIEPCYRMVDTCAAEFSALTPYYYSTFGEENETQPMKGESVVILGSGPNRIGQGIEFDYCCVQVAMTLREHGYKVIMVNCNPETVSTDYDIADRLYFEPLTFEDVIGICKAEKPLGVVVQFGGGTPLKLVGDLAMSGISILGTGWEAINVAEDRGQFEVLCNSLGIKAPEFGTATSVESAVEVARKIGYPVLVRPSYVLGGRAMEIIYDEKRLKSFFFEAAEASDGDPVLIDKFLEDAFEFDVDAVADGETCLIAGIMQHIEEAGIHSGDSACVIPPYMLSDEVRAEMIRVTKILADKLGLIGLLNLQFALLDNQLYVLELNPRASRTVPFISKATGVPWARIAARVIMGEKLADMNLPDDPKPPHVAVKAVKFPFARFDHINYFLGPEMKSTGEVMGISDTFGDAFARAQAAVRAPLPVDGGVFISVNNNDKEKVVPIARELNNLGFKIWATSGTNDKLIEEGIPSNMLYKVGEGRPNVVDQMKNGLIHMIVNTPLGRESRYDERAVGREAYLLGIPNITTLSGAWAAVSAIKSLREHGLTVKPIQEYIENFAHRQGCR